MGLDSAQYCPVLGHLNCRRRWRLSSRACRRVIVAKLEQLVKEIREGGTLETGALAVRLGTTPQLIEAMLGHLQRSGLIQAYMSCGDGCQGCSLQDACKKPDQSTMHLWQSKSES